MSARQRWACLALLLGTLGGLAIWLDSMNGPLWAGPRPVPGKTAQSPSSPEPPLAGQGPAPAPQPLRPAPSQPAQPQQQYVQDYGTPCPDDPPTPVVALRIRVPSTAGAGQDLEYHICVENRSNAAAHHVTVRNPIPAHARYVRATPEPSAREPELVWNLGTLEACTCREIVLVLQPTGGGDIENCARVQFEHGQCVCTRIARPGLGVRKCGPAHAVLNETLTYQICVTNTGATELTGVMLTDTLAPGLEHSSGRMSLTWEVGRLAPGESRSVEYQVTARAAGRHCNRAVATAGGLREEAESCVTVGEARISIDKTGPAQRYVNLPATYSIMVVNTGSTALQNVVVTDPLPAQMSFVSAGQGGRLVNNQVQWSLGALEPGASRTVDVILRAQQAGRICNRAMVTADRGITAQSEFCTTFIGVSALLLEVVDSDDPVETGATTSYIILVRNQGTQQATNIRIEAIVPNQMGITRVSGPADHRKQEQRVTFNPVNLDPRGEARYTVYVKAFQAGQVRFRAILTADQLTAGPVTEEESTNIYADIPARPQPGVRESREP